jgi:hypothetical protein
MLIVNKVTGKWLQKSVGGLKRNAIYFLVVHTKFHQNTLCMCAKNAH